MAFDIIGDIHGQADKLEALLRLLGYQQSSGAWRHGTRQAIFVGDFIDRGPHQRRSVEIARRMLDAGSARAVMGNHEFNAIAWHTPDPRPHGEYLRPHHGPHWGDKNRQQHVAFLAEFESDPTLHAEVVDWFLTLPLWLELPGLRVVHACWHQRFIEWLTPSLKNGRLLTRELMAEATTEPDDPGEKDTAEPSVFKAVDALVKGLEIPLPLGETFMDKDGHRRDRARVRWWDSTARTYRDGVLGPLQQEALPPAPLPAHVQLELGATPVCFGHYWLTGTPSLQSARAVCVDYSAGRGGPLVAYRFDGEPELLASRLVFVP